MLFKTFCTQIREHHYSYSELRFFQSKQHILKTIELSFQKHKNPEKKAPSFIGEINSQVSTIELKKHLKINPSNEDSKYKFFMLASLEGKREIIKNCDKKEIILLVMKLKKIQRL
jgi:hypothetical protein